MEPNKLISRRYKALISGGRDFANHKSFAINPHQRDNKILTSKHSGSRERFGNNGLGAVKSHQRSQRSLFETKPSQSLHRDNTVESFDLVNSKNQNSYESLTRTLNPRPTEKRGPTIKFNPHLFDSRSKNRITTLYPSKLLSGNKKSRRSKQMLIENEQKQLINENLGIKAQLNRLIEENKKLKDQLQIAEVEIVQKNKLLQDIVNK